MNHLMIPRWIVILQYLSLIWIWVFVLGISVWIVHLVRLSAQLNDVPSASIGISLVAIPVFLTGASVLTYVFFGLRRSPIHDSDTTSIEEDTRHVEESNPTSAE